jgi:AcrR family transcriptional regulator
MKLAEPGLRERKRSETRSRLETAAVSLVLANGLENTTIDAICAAADVSSRTFFNYFESKEDAILGLRDPDLTDDAISEVLARGGTTDPVESIIRLLFGVLNPTIASSALFSSRMRIVKEHPGLLGRMADQMQRMNEQFAAAIRPILREAPSFNAESPADFDLSIEVILALCGSATRAVVKEWAANGSQAPLEAIEQRAIELVKTTVERIA